MGSDTIYRISPDGEVGPRYCELERVNASNKRQTGDSTLIDFSKSTLAEHIQCIFVSFLPDDMQGTDAADRAPSRIHLIKIKDYHLYHVSSLSMEL